MVSDCGDKDDDDIDYDGDNGWWMIISKYDDDGDDDDDHVDSNGDFDFSDQSFFMLKAEVYEQRI